MKQVSHTPDHDHENKVVVDNSFCHDSNYQSRLGDSYYKYPQRVSRTHCNEAPNLFYQGPNVQPSQHYSNVPATSYYNTPSLNHSHTPVETCSTRPVRVIHRHMDDRVSYRRMEQPREVYNRSYVSDTNSYYSPQTHHSYSTYPHAGTHSTYPHTGTHNTYPHTGTHTNEPVVDNHHETEPESSGSIDQPEVTVNSKKNKPTEVVVEGKKKNTRHNVPSPIDGRKNQGCCAKIWPDFCGC